MTEPAADAVAGATHGGAVADEATESAGGARASVDGNGDAADPWLALDEPNASPAQVDAIARDRLGRIVVDDVRRSAGLTSWLVRRAAADGSTTVDGTTWAAVLRGYGIDAPRPGLDAAAAAGRVVALPAERAIAHPRWGPLEERIADDLHAVLASGGPDDAPDDPFEIALAMPVCAVVVGRGSRDDVWITRLRKRADAAGRQLAVVPDAHRLDLDAAGQLLEDHDVDASLVLVGDPDQLGPVEPGRFFGDVVASGVVPTVRLPVTSAEAMTTEPANGDDAAADDGPITRLVESLRTGELPPVESGQHALVVSTVADAGQALARVVELATEALPRVLGVGPSDVLVLGIRAAGAVGVEALREAVGDAVGVAAVHDAVGRRAEAVVLALPAESAGSLTRAHLISAASTAGRQLSIVHQAGPALAAAVRHRPHRPRHTRLARLLRA